MAAKREWQDKWIAALRSGEYAQTRGILAKVSLQRPGYREYCCLGVAKMVYHGAFNERWTHIADLAQDHEIQDTFGFRDGSGAFNGVITIPGKGTAVSFVSCNDSLGMSFSEIADMIEEHRDIVFSSDD